MYRTIVNPNEDIYQLISIGIELAHKVGSLIDCNPHLATNAHVKIVNDLSVKFNEAFIEAFITSREGSK